MTTFIATSGMRRINLDMAVEIIDMGNYIEVVLPDGTKRTVRKGIQMVAIRDWALGKDLIVR